MRYVAFMTLLAAFAITVSAQTDVDEKKKQINAIKKSSDYIFAEATMADRQDALDLVKDILLQNVNEWVAKQKKFADTDKVVTINTNYAIEDVTLPRGNWYRAFMYVKKSDVIPAANVTVTKLSDPEKSADSDEGDTPVETGTDGQISDELRSIFVAQENTGQLGTLVKQLKAEGTITDYNKLSALANPDEYVLFIFSKEGNIMAVLTPAPNRQNLKTGKPDAVSNYKGCGAVGVMLKRSNEQ